MKFKFSGKKERKNQVGTAVAAAKVCSDTKTGMEALARSGGRNPQLKGVVHEIMYKNRYNADPTRIKDGAKAVLSKSPIAVRDDILIKKGGKIIGRAQLKDTPKSIGKTIQQVQSGHYRGTVLMGTSETTKAYGKAAVGKVTQKMTDSGISSTDTARVAAQTIGGKVTVGAVTKAAQSSGCTGAILSGGVAAVSSGRKLARGEISAGECASTIAKETIGGGVSAAAGSSAATVTSTLVAGAVAATTAPAWVPAVAGGVAAFGAACAVGSTAKKLSDAACGIAESEIKNLVKQPDGQSPKAQTAAVRKKRRLAQA